jgi:hypothetical protein
VFENGGNVVPNVNSGGEREEFLSGAGDEGLAFLEIDSCNGVRQRVIEEETLQSIMPRDGGLPVMTKV